MEKKTNKMFWVFFVIFAAALSFGVWYYVSQKEREQVYTDLAEEAKTEEPEKETEEDARYLRKTGKMDLTFPLPGLMVLIFNFMVFCLISLF